MPTGPKGQKRPADVIGNAVKVMRIATGDENENYDTTDGKDPAAIRIHKTLKMSPAMAAGVSKTLWSMDDLCGMMDAVAPKPGPRGPYRKRG